MRGRNRTKEEQNRFEEIQQRGCLPCFLESFLRKRLSYEPEPCDIHHTSGGNNHLATYGNCPWHHRGVPKNDLTAKEMKAVFGPSMAINPKEYRQRYGCERTLLDLQNNLLKVQPENLIKAVRLGVEQ